VVLRSVDDAYGWWRVPGEVLLSELCKTRGALSEDWLSDRYESCSRGYRKPPKNKFGIKGDNMQSVTLVVDESGAKGFSDNREAVIGELGVIAGLLIPSKCVSRVETDISSIVSGLSSTGKLHITDLDLSAQQKLREELFSYLLGVSACCVYEAIYVEGLYSHQQLVSDIQADQR
jgi:hypothetical protein